MLPWPLLMTQLTSFPECLGTPRDSGVTAVSNQTHSFCSAEIRCWKTTTGLAWWLLPNFMCARAKKAGSGRRRPSGHPSGLLDVEITRAQTAV